MLSRALRHQPTERVRHTLSPEAAAIAPRLAELFGRATCGVIHYGSRAQGRASAEDSACDFIIVLDNYGSGYRFFARAARRGGSSARRVRVRQRPRVARMLAELLPPNSLAAVVPVGDRLLSAKCLVISAAHLKRECGAAARDHFMRARLMQLAQIAWTRDAPAAADLAAQIVAARRGTFGWAQVFLPREFDLATYCHLLLDISLRAELRLEPPAQAKAWFACQRTFLENIYQPILEDRVRTGVLEGAAERYRLLVPPSWERRLRTRVWFAWSRVRTTARLLKHPLLYEGWLSYLRRKRARLRRQYA